MVPKLVLLYAVMEALGAAAVTYRHVYGNAAGLMASPDYWP